MHHPIRSHRILILSTRLNSPRFHPPVGTSAAPMVRLTVLWDFAWQARREAESSHSEEGDLRSGLPSCL